MEKHILLVEDDVRLASLVKEYLMRNGFRVTVEHRGDQAEGTFSQETFDVVILDIMLPGMDGFQICQAIRPSFRGPILMMTARDDDLDQVTGLEIGADDYVVKPVQPRVLLARVRALLRRFSEQNTESGEDALNKPDRIVHGNLVIDETARRVTLEQDEISLTSNEFTLLLLLVQNSGEVVSRDAALEKLRGIGYDGLDRSIDITVSRLRRKLGDVASPPQWIKTVRGKGYLLVPDAWG